MGWVAGQALANAPDADWRARLRPPTDAWRKVPQHFIFNNGADPQTVDPTLVTGVPEARLADALFEGLTTLDPMTLTPRPGVASHWTVSADGLQYTFQLRPNAKWSNGQPVTAQDFVRSWERALTPRTGAAYAYQLYPLRQAEAFHRGQVTDFAQVGVQATGPHTLVVTLGEPCSFFLTLTAFHTLYPVPVAAIAQHGERWILPANIVGNGPYALASWEPRQRIELVRNPHYWDDQFRMLEKITVLPYDDLETAYRLFQQGKLHWMDGIPLPKLDEVRRDPGYYAVPYLATYFYRFNVTRPPLDDARVRRALSMAVDRRVITEHILRAGQQPAAHFCPPVAGYQPVPGLPFDRDRARALLAEAGYGPGGKPWPKVELLFNTSEAHKKVAEAVAQQWQTNLGVTVSVRNAEWKVYLADTENLNYQIARAAWIGDYNDPNTFFDLFIGQGGNNRTGWANAAYDALYRQSRGEADPATRMAIFQRMEKLLVEEECPIMPLYIYVTQGLLSDRVGGWYENVRDWHPLQYVWLEE